MPSKIQNGQLSRGWLNSEVPKMRWNGLFSSIQRFSLCLRPFSRHPHRACIRMPVMVQTWNCLHSFHFSDVLRHTFSAHLRFLQDFLQWRIRSKFFTTPWKSRHTMQLSIDDAFFCSAFRRFQSHVPHRPLAWISKKINQRACNINAGVARCWGRILNFMMPRPCPAAAAGYQRTVHRRGTWWTWIDKANTRWHTYNRHKAHIKRTHFGGAAKKNVMDTGRSYN